MRQFNINGQKLQHRFGVFENREIRRIFGSTMQEVTGG
jgi:hypothetical protein